MDEESMDTFMSITGASQLVAVQKLTEHGGVLNEAVNSYFTQPDTNIRHAAPDKDNLMDIDETSHRGNQDVPTEQAKAFGESETRAEVEHRLGVGTSFVQDEAEEQPRVRRRTRRIPSAPAQHHNPDEWGGISSEERDEAVMLEAAMFGGAGYHVPYPRTRRMRRSYYTRSAPRSPSPTLTAQRLIREQQNDEYLASLQADREKELLEQAAREAALEEEERKLEQEQEIERQVAAKETSLPPEPASDEDNAVTLLVRMPDGSRRGRRFMKTDKLRYLLDFIDVGRVVKPSTYRLVRPYPRRAFGDGESDLTLNQLGLTSKQEALFLELI